MATVRKRILKSGKVRFTCWYTDRDGIRRSKDFKLKGDANAYRDQVGMDVRAGTHVPDSQSITVAEAADAWADACENDGLELSTVRQYRQHVAHHIKPLVGAEKLSRLTTPRCKQFVDDLLEVCTNLDVQGTHTNEFAKIHAHKRTRWLNGCTG